jgi:hypothetical protein
MSDIESARRGLVQRLLEGDGRAARAIRAAALQGDRSGLPECVGMLAEKIIGRPSEVCEDDIEAARSGGLSEDQLFELIVCVAVGEATREHEAALSALDAAERG